MDNLKELACPCGSLLSYETCCKDFITNLRLPDTAEQLMRSRYTAYVLENATYIIDTTHPRMRHLHTKRSILAWAKENNWEKLSILSSGADFVEFKAFFKDAEGIEHCHYEHSIFEKLGDKWYYVTGTYND